MRISVLVAWLPFVPSPAGRECVIVQGSFVETPVLAPNVRIVVTQAGIDIWTKVGDNTRALAARMSTGSDGRFALQLDSGHYVAFVRFPGFRTSRLLIEITSGDSAQRDRVPVAMIPTAAGCT
jgi:hypothetical protein